METGDLSPLNEAIAVLTEAVASTPPGDPDRPAFQSFLGHALETRYEASANPEDIDAALTAYRDGAPGIGRTRFEPAVSRPGMGRAGDVAVRPA